MPTINKLRSECLLPKIDVTKTDEMVIFPAAVTFEMRLVESNSLKDEKNITGSVIISKKRDR